MKFKSLFFLVLTALFFSSCFEVEETYNLKEDGSYQMSYSLNMGKALDAFGGMITDSIKNTKEFSTVKDTTVNFGNAMPDSLAKELSVQEKTLLKHTSMHMQMNMPKKLFRVSFQNEGKSTTELSYFLGNFGRLLKQSNAKEIMQPSGKVPTEDSSDTEDDNLFNANDYDYVITKSSFQRTIKKELFKQKKENQQQANDLLKSMNLSMPYTIIINLPRPAASINHPKGTLSANRKQFKLTFDMIETLEDPSLLDFKINY